MTRRQDTINEIAEKAAELVVERLRALNPGFVDMAFCTERSGRIADKVDSVKFWLTRLIFPLLFLILAAAVGSVVL